MQPELLEKFIVTAKKSIISFFSKNPSILSKKHQQQIIDCPDSLQICSINRILSSTQVEGEIGNKILETFKQSIYKTDLSDNHSISNCLSLFDNQWHQIKI